MIEICAHRGASGHAPENTMPAFIAAAQLSADSIELDVHRSKDGRIVVIHDETVNRTSNGRGVVEQMTWQELRALDFSKPFATPEYKNVPIPCLEEVLEFLQGNRLKLNIELKTDENIYEGIEEEVVRLVEKYGVTHKTYYSSFNHDSIERLLQCNPTCEAGILYSMHLNKVWNYAVEIGAKAIHPRSGLVNKRLAQECAARNLQLRSWTVNEEKAMLEQVELGVTGLITNYPDIARKVLSRV